MANQIPITWRIKERLELHGGGRSHPKPITSGKVTEATIVISDLSESKDLIAQGRVRDLRNYINEHSKLVRRAIAGSGGVIMGPFADSIQIYFEGKARLEFLEVARRIQADAIAAKRKLGAGLKIGVTSGEVYKEDNVLYGPIVVIAHDLSVQAATYGILVDTKTASLLRSSTRAIERNMKLTGHVMAARHYARRKRYYEIVTDKGPFGVRLK